LQVDFDTNFQDREAFVAGISKFVEEAQSLADLVRFIIPFPSPSHLPHRGC
jgi:hypothetical protein